MINEINENMFVQKLVHKFGRSPLQLNKLNESDAELIQIADNQNQVLAITTDSINEEIAIGLYDDPYLTGWMAVMVNLSDLAAVGAKPIGILISEILPKNFSKAALKQLQKGINDACTACDTYILGGDTNFGDQLVLTGIALGTIDKNNFITRIGAKQGDSVYVSGQVGGGNIFALLKLLHTEETKYDYKPIARIKEGQIVNQFASCAMDTSDGVLSTLDQLMRLNNVGFELKFDWERSIKHEDIIAAQQNRLPLWLLLAGQHGEFELLFTIPNNIENVFLEEANKQGWNPIKIGTTIQEQEIKIPLYGKLVSVDTRKIRNIDVQSNLGISSYLKSLLTIDEDLKFS